MSWSQASKLSATLQVMFQNRTGKLALVDLYYEWGRGRNANLIHAQQGSTLYDIGAASCSAVKPVPVTALPAFDTGRLPHVIRRPYQISYCTHTVTRTQCPEVFVSLRSDVARVGRRMQSTPTALASTSTLSRKPAGASFFVLDILLCALRHASTAWRVLHMAEYIYATGWSNSRWAS